MIRVATLIPAIGICLAAAGCAPESATENEAAASAPPVETVPSATVVNDAAMADEDAAENWLAFGRTYSEQRYSPLDQINDQQRVRSLASSGTNRCRMLAD